MRRLLVLLNDKTETFYIEIPFMQHQKYSTNNKISTCMIYTFSTWKHSKDLLNFCRNYSPATSGCPARCVLVLSKFLYPIYIFPIAKKKKKKKTISACHTSVLNAIKWFYCWNKPPRLLSSIIPIDFSHILSHHKEVARISNLLQTHSN